VLAIAGIPNSFGQAAPTTEPAAAAAAEADVVVLSPFVVSATEDTGYGATSTLAGTRVRTELKDVASSISVVTQQFLRDTGSKKSEDLLVYTTNTEVSGSRGNFSNAVGSAAAPAEDRNLLRPNESTRVRGLAAADNTRDYFLTEIPWDGYNVGRVDLQRGPNSILFGNGSPAGIINTSLNTAGFKNAGTAEARFDDQGSVRASVDGNYVAIDKVLALRVASVYDNTKYQQKPAYNLDRRVFAALRFDPKLFGNGATSFRVNFEQGNVKANRPRNTPPVDRITPWFTPKQETGSTVMGLGKAGQFPLIANPTQSYELYSGSAPQGDIGFRKARMGGIYGPAPVLYFNANEQPPLTGYLNNQATGIGQLAATQAFYLAVPGYNEWSSNGSGILGGLNYKDVTLSDPSIFDFYKNLLDGDNKREWQKWHAANFAFSQTFFDNRLGFELVYDRQRYQDGQEGMFTRGNFISVDVNTHMLDGNPNPNVGRPYVTSQNGSGNLSNIDRDSIRFSAFAEFRATDFMGKSTLSKIIGRHLFTGVLTQDDKNTESRSWQMLATDRTYAAAVGEASSKLGTDGRHVNFVSYLGNDSFLAQVAPNNYNDYVLTALSAADSNLPRLGSVAFPGAIATRIFDKTWNAPSVNPAAPFTYTRWNNFGQAESVTGTQVDNQANYVGWTTTNTKIYNAANGDIDELYTGASKSKNRVESISGTWQGYFWDDSLVGTLGWRYDKVSTRAVSAPVDQFSVAQPGYYDFTGSTVEKTGGHSLSWGAVYHVKPLDKVLPANTKLSLIFNKGQNFKADARRPDAWGDPLANSSGRTQEYGFAVTTLNDRLTFKLIHFETSQAEASLAGINGGFNELWKIRAIPQWGINQALLALPTLTASYADGGCGLAIPGVPAGLGRNDWLATSLVTAHSGAASTVEYNDLSPAQRLAGAQFYLESVRTLMSTMPDAWNQNFFDRYGPDWINVAGARSTNVADWYANVPNLNMAQQPRDGDRLQGYAGTAVFTGNTLSKGYEFEATARVTDNWDMSLNVSKTFATISALNPTFATKMDEVTAYLATDAGATRWWGGGVNDSLNNNWQNSLVREYRAMQSKIGAQVSELPTWRANLVTTYRLSQGTFKGTFVGGAFRWEGKRVIGYGVYPDGHTFEGLLNVDDPLNGESESHIDLWVGYGRPITSKINWKIQLNVRNVGEGNKRVHIARQPNGDVAQDRIQYGMGWSLTNTFSF
jgi:outer membrane receptor for ferric coprogen and ferric-rhodotorulic acid